MLGCKKPDPRMCHQASSALGLSPAQCMFVVDDAELVAAAIDLGYAGRALCRHGNKPSKAVPSISSLSELRDFF